MYRYNPSLLTKQQPADEAKRLAVDFKNNAVVRALARYVQSFAVEAEKGASAKFNAMFKVSLPKRRHSIPADATFDAIHKTFQPLEGRTVLKFDLNKYW